MDLGSVISLALFSFGLMVIIAGLASLLIRGIVIVLAGARAKAAPAPTPVVIAVEPAVDETAADVAAIAAAVYAVLGAHRLVHIHEVPRGPGWTATGRLAHHGSHLPRHSPR
jgi:hypothetical protein